MKAGTARDPLLTCFLAWLFLGILTLWVPGFGATDSIWRPLSFVPLSVLTTVTVNPGVPVSCCWNARCRPDNPS